MYLFYLLQAERMITDYAKNIYRIEERMRDSEARAAEASKQVSYVYTLYMSVCKVMVERAKKIIIIF